jgi:hypothetical protein
MSVITIDSNRLLDMLTELGRQRALTDRETDLIEDIVMQDQQPFRWSTGLDLGLQRAAITPGGIARFARRHNITAGMAYARLHRLRKRKGGKGARQRRRG